MTQEMCDIPIVTNIDGYAIALVLGGISLKTLAKHHKQAIESNLLDESQKETANMILYDLTRAINLYKSQFDNLIEENIIEVDDIQKKLSVILDKQS